MRKSVTQFWRSISKETWFKGVSKSYNVGFPNASGDITRSVINDEATLFVSNEKGTRKSTKINVCCTSESWAGPTAAEAVPEATNGHGTRSQTSLVSCESPTSVRQPHSRWTAVPNLTNSTPARGAGWWFF